MGAFRGFWLLTVLLFFAGCAPRAVVLTPGPVPMSPEEGRIGGPFAWSVALKEVRDSRPPETSGERVGTLYSRFKGNPQAAFLDPSPARYVGEQLSRYLLHRGLEASTPDAAKLYLAVDVHDFALVETPGRVWDQIMVRVAYTVFFSDRSGRALGHVKLSAAKQVDVTVGPEGQAKQGFREAVAETFGSLVQSDVFLRVLGSQGG